MSALRSRASIKNAAASSRLNCHQEPSASDQGSSANTIGFALACSTKCRYSAAALWKFRYLYAREKGGAEWTEEFVAQANADIERFLENN